MLIRLILKTKELTLTTRNNFIKIDFKEENDCRWKFLIYVVEMCESDQDFLSNQFVIPCVLRNFLV